MTDWKARVGSSFHDGLGYVASFFRNLIADFKESNRVFKVKIMLVAGYLVMGLATAIVFLPPVELNEIDATVRISKTEIVGGRYFLVGNQSSDPWKEVVLTLNESYMVRWPVLQPGRKKAFFFRQFKDKMNRAPAEDLMVKTLRIDSHGGSFLRDFAEQ